MGIQSAVHLLDEGNQLRGLGLAALGSHPVRQGVERVGQGFGQVVERDFAAVPAQAGDLAVASLENLRLRRVDLHVGHLPAGKALCLEVEVGHHHVPVVVRVDAVAHRQRERRLSGLHAPADFDHRGAEIHELPAVGCSRLLLEPDDAIHHGVLAPQRSVVLDLGRFVVGRTPEHHDPHAVEGLQALLHLLEVVVALPVLLFAECPGIVAVVFHVARVVHAEGHGQHRGAFAENVAVQALVHVACGLAADAGVHHPQIHVREAGHVIEPDVGVVVAAVGDAVAEEYGAVTVLERRYGLRRGGSAHAERRRKG